MLLVSAGGRPERNCWLLRIPKGVTFRHWNRIPGLNAGGVGCHTPGSELEGKKEDRGEAAVGDIVAAFQKLEGGVDGGRQRPGRTKHKSC